MLQNGFYLIWLLLLFGLSNSGALNDPHPELSDQELFWGADQYDFSIMLQHGDLQCYWHFAHFGERFYLNFMVQLVTGVALDRHLSVTVNAPSGLIVGQVDDASGQIAFNVKETVVEHSAAIKLPQQGIVYQKVN
ncbi:transmembrane emp24 domain-containing protein 6-like [Sinocyclocheilus grahami]|uniref:transmembrane emp24 domain-containing protein 6-like n=1 Tax=Sinocyclocheilus grahami TaxID=75366 RepID=UPI0007AD0082|nr:PREDICTED: transmembrane emp24 domain-containing protein 6-like [Sinocyclocheilus grahami]